MHHLDQKVKFLVRDLCCYIFCRVIDMIVTVLIRYFSDVKLKRVYEKPNRTKVAVYN